MFSIEDLTLRKQKGVPLPSAKHLDEAVVPLSDYEGRNSIPFYSADIATGYMGTACTGIKNPACNSGGCQSASSVMFSVAKVGIIFELGKGMGKKFHREAEITLDCVGNNVTLR